MEATHKIELDVVSGEVECSYPESDEPSLATKVFTTVANKLVNDEEWVIGLGKEYDDAAEE